MTPNEEQYFFDLATKVIAKRATHDEARQFETLLNQNDEYRDRFEMFKADVIVAKDIISLVDASEAKGAGLSEAQLSRLKDEVGKMAAKTKKERAKRIIRLVLIFIGLLIAVVVGILIYKFSGSKDTITGEDMTTPNAIIRSIPNNK
jgi:hypothetical protein